MGVFTLWIFTKKPWKMKKAFCFDYFSMSRSESKFFHVWFEFFPSYLSKKKEISETFLGLGLRPRPQKTFPRFPFFYFGNLGKTQIRRGKILLQTWHGKKSKQNTISFYSLLGQVRISLQNRLAESRQKMVFCSVFFLWHVWRKIFDLWFEFFPSYRSRQKGTEGKFFEAEAAFLRP